MSLLQIQHKLSSNSSIESRDYISEHIGTIIARSKAGRLRTVMKKENEQGFTLIELLVVVAIIGILASLAFISYRSFTERARASRAASELRSFGTAFLAYNYTTGGFPPDSHNELPPGMEEYLASAVFNRPTPLGGRYNWEGPDGYPYAGISLFEPTAPQSAIVALDALLDDGDLNSGRFRIMSNGRPTFVLEETS